jgi:sugar/nucleoside kinase (ribokinase family)
MGVGLKGGGAVIIRSGALGAYVATRDGGGHWVDAYWTEGEAHRVVDVTGLSSSWQIKDLYQMPCVLRIGAGNAFLGGLAAGLALTNWNLHEGQLA